MERLARLEAAQSMLLDIGELSTTCSDIVDFIGAVHRALGDVLLACQDGLGFVAVIGMLELQCAAVEAEAGQGQLGDVMDVRLVVD